MFVRRAALLFAIAVTAAADIDHQDITFCIHETTLIELPAAPGKPVEIPIADGIVLRGVATGDFVADFEVLRHGRACYRFHLDDYSCNGAIIWSVEAQAFAFTYSDGGAIGNFHVRIFSLRDGKCGDISSMIGPAVRDFASRHYCRTRGNNVTVLKWLNKGREMLLMTEVYPTSDCGPGLGYTEGYVIRVPGGTILRRLSERQLKRYPGVCLDKDTSE